MPSTQSCVGVDNLWRIATERGLLEAGLRRYEQPYHEPREHHADLDDERERATARRGRRGRVTSTAWKVIGDFRAGWSHAEDMARLARLRAVELRDERDAPRCVRAVRHHGSRVDQLAWGFRLFSIGVAAGAAASILAGKPPRIEEPTDESVKRWAYPRLGRGRPRGDCAVRSDQWRRRHRRLQDVSAGQEERRRITRATPDVTTSRYAISASGRASWQSFKCFRISKKTHPSPRHWRTTFAGRVRAARRLERRRPWLGSPEGAPLPCSNGSSHRG